MIIIIVQKSRVKFNFLQEAGDADSRAWTKVEYFINPYASTSIGLLRLSQSHHDHCFATTIDWRMERL